MTEEVQTTTNTSTQSGGSAMTGTEVSTNNALPAEGGYGMLGEFCVFVGGILLGILLLHLWSKRCRRLETSSPNSPQGVQSRKLFFQERPIFFVVSVRVKDIKKSDSITECCKYTSSYWIGKEVEWKKLLEDLQRAGAHDSLPLEEVKKQEDDTDLIVAFRSMWQVHKPQPNTFLGLVKAVKKADPDPTNDISYYIYPRQLNLLEKEFGFQKG